MCCLVGLGQCLLSPLNTSAQQVPDTTYMPLIASPSFEEGEGPTVAIDAAHLNFHTADGRYRSFAELLRRDGYVVASNTLPFTRESLNDIDVLVISNAMHRQSEAHWAPLPNLSAFTDAEIAAVETWVRRGGSLLLIADHMPLAGHAEALAAAFGVRFQNGFTVRNGTQRQGTITFRRSDQTLNTSIATEGRSNSERVDSVTTFMGQAFRIDPDVEFEPLLTMPEGYALLLPEVAWEMTDTTPRIPAAYLLQGAIVHHGVGRVAVFGEAAMFSAQLAGPSKRPMGMNNPIAGQNYQFALNILRWLGPK